jgi:hypothetical protein
VVYSQKDCVGQKVVQSESVSKRGVNVKVEDSTVQYRRLYKALNT